MNIDQLLICPCKETFNCRLTKYFFYYEKVFLSIAIATLSFVSLNVSAAPTVNPQPVQEEVSAVAAQSDIVIIIIDADVIIII
ncbi:MAG: hypothetical protein RSH25_15410 [Bacteroides sp.]|uniref:hypothetical protein n=1 Tax=Bacteroides sp. TaxID=29523 RepID=UPI002FC8F4AC